MNTKNLKQAEMFALLAMLFLIATLFSSSARTNVEDRYKTLHRKVEKLTKLRDRLLALKNETPPIINLTEKDPRFRFASGSAILSDDFKDGLLSLLPRLDRLAEKYDCDMIEVVGHTDNMPLKKSLSSMDGMDAKPGKTRAGSNVDLGMLRAISVMRELEQARQQQDKLQNIAYILPYSAGQFISVDSKLVWGKSPQGDHTRRRIEIRLSRSPALQAKRRARLKAITKEVKSH